MIGYCPISDYTFFFFFLEWKQFTMANWFILEWTLYYILIVVILVYMYGAEF